MAEIEKKWYVLRAISGKEAKVKEYLEADLKNSDRAGHCCILRLGGLGLKAGWH